jgi:hypothetical protein
VSTAKAQRRLDVERSVASPSEDGLGIASRKPHPTDQTDASLTPEQKRERLAAFELFLLGRAGFQEEDG